MSSSSKMVVDKKMNVFQQALRWVYRKMIRVFSGKKRLVHFTLQGISYLIWSDEDIAKKMRISRSFEPDETSVFQRLIKKGDICVDVGGNIGYYTLNMASLCGSGGHVYAFEPLRRNALTIELAVEINGFKNVTVETKAVSNENTMVSMNVPEEDGAYAYIDSNSSTGLHMAQAVRLDDYCKNNGIERIDILKIDIEGAEKMALEGLSTIFSSEFNAPRLVMVELVDQFLDRFGSSVAEIISLMKSYGYSPYYAAAGGKLIEFSDSDIGGLFNVFFVNEKP